MRQHGISDSVLFHFDGRPTPNFQYFCSYDGFGGLVIPAKGKPTLVVPQMEADRARSSGFSVEVYKKTFFDSIKHNTSSNKVGEMIGLDYSGIALSEYQLIKKRMLEKTKQWKQRLAFKDVSSLCTALRVTKTPEELAIMRKAFSMADSIVKECFSTLPGSCSCFTEKEVAVALEKATLDRGCTLSFPVIVGSGKASAIPHYEPRNVKLSHGFCVVDFGIRYKGYCTDMTRTFFIGTPSVKEQGMYTLLRNAQEKTIALTASERSCSALHQKCEAMLGKYKAQFIHSLGHGVGIEVHESPSLSLRSPDILREGMVFTIEPGVYFPGKFGIRIEDTLVMGRKKAECFTHLSKDLITIRPS